MTTHEFSFDEIEAAFEMMDDKRDDIVKPLIRFD
jgi:threonine dehydrogenase-like Zn-dependent dehydrogenase